MMLEKTPSEPSMDDILASIRKIIAADEKESQSPFFPHSSTEEVLDLIEPLPEDLGKTYNAGTWSPSSDKIHSFKDEDKEPDNVNIKETPDTLSSFDDLALAHTTISETAQAFDLLSKPAGYTGKESSSDIGGQTLENLAQDMLKPLLREWLDRHLPGLVREVVTQQVEKIVSRKD